MSDDKYITYKRKDLANYFQSDVVPWDMEDIEVKDAVVIRRQDLFASPALAGYAAAIAIAIRLTTDADVAKELMKVADYFQRQSELAADEGFKYPDV